MASDDDPPRGRPRSPGELRFVGPATAELLEDAPFSAEDVAAGRVSYRALLEVGVQPAVAEQLRTEYALVWAFRWQVGGGDLPERARRLRGLGEEERAWIAASDRSEDGEDPPSELAVIGRSRGEVSDRALAAWLGPIVTEAIEVAGSCPRCGGGLDRFELGDRVAIQCEDCGWAGVPFDRTRPRQYRLAVDEEEWEDALQRFLDARSPGESTEE